MPALSSLLDAARARWAQIRAEQPAVVPALPLHEQLLTGLIVDLEALPREAADGARRLGPAVLGSLQQGVPAFHETAEPPALAACVGHLGWVAAVLSSGGAGPAAAKLTSAIESGLIDPAVLVRASWRRDSTRVAALASAAGLNLQVAWLVAELATAALAHAWQEGLLESGEAVRDAVEHWDRGHCPACGAWPSLAECFLGDRLNRCAYCAAAWPLSTQRCTYCGERGADFRTIVANRGTPGRRLELCRACGGYLKTIDVARPTPFPLLAIEDLASQDLDRVAQRHGFRRVSLRRNQS